jgi:hypothetical protein
LLEHDLFRKPVSTFRDHAPGSRHAPLRAPDCIRASAGPYNDTSTMEFAKEHGRDNAAIGKSVTT